MTQRINWFLSNHEQRTNEFESLAYSFSEKKKFKACTIKPNGGVA